MDLGSDEGVVGLGPGGDGDASAAGVEVFEYAFDLCGCFDGVGVVDDEELVAGDDAGGVGFPPLAAVFEPLVECPVGVGVHYSGDNSFRHLYSFRCVGVG